MRVPVTAATEQAVTGEIAQAIEGGTAVVLGWAVYAGHWLESAGEFVDRSCNLRVPTTRSQLLDPISSPRRRAAQ